MNPNQPIYDRSRRYAPAPKGKPPNPPRQDAEVDAYLNATCTAKTPVSVHFLDGEAIPSAVIKAVNVFTLLLEVKGETWLAYKNALKKIVPVVQP